MMMICAGATGKAGDTGLPGAGDYKPSSTSITTTSPVRQTTSARTTTTNLRPAATTQAPCYGLPGKNACIKTLRFYHSLHCKNEVFRKHFLGGYSGATNF